MTRNRVICRVSKKKLDNLLDGAVPGVKPKFRGVLDVIAFAWAMPASSALYYLAPSGVQSWCALSFGLALIWLYLISALYHVPMWPEKIRKTWRKLDLSAIFLFFGGCYTPICLLVFPEGQGKTLLVVIWIIVFIGCVKCLVWPQAPRFINTLLYNAFGWLTLCFLPTLITNLSPLVFTLLILGGVFHTLGAIVYAKRWPNPNPYIFGYHEVFHVLLLMATTTHFAAFWHIILKIS